MSDEPRERPTLEELAAQSAGNAHGMACPRCNCKDFRSYRREVHQSQYLRYRYCRHCGYRGITKQAKEELLRDVEPYGDAEDSSNGIISLTTGKAVA